MNAVIIGVILMLGLTLVRVNVIVAMTISALVAGLTAGMGLKESIDAFNSGLSSGADCFKLCYVRRICRGNF